MLMAIKLKEVNVFPILEILIRPLEEEEEVKFLRYPEQYYYHLKLTLEQSRIGRNIIQEFIDRELTHEGITWLVGELVKRDRQFEKACRYVIKLGNKQDSNPGRL